MPSAVEVGVDVARWAAGAWLLWTVPVPPPEQVTLDGVVVIVPARDEEATLPALLASLRGRPVDVDAVIVVDDGSTDATAAVAAAAGAHVVDPGDPPAGWTGKAWACHAGAAHERARAARTLVFADADTRFLPGGLERVVAAQRARGGLVSVQPFHVMERPYERLSAFFNLVGLMGAGTTTPAHRPPTGAFGPCLAVDRATYDSAGGHARHPGTVLDDVALADAVRATGAPVTVYGGRGAVDFRMYPGGLRQLVDGWTKNMAAGAARTRPATMLLVVAWISGLLTAPWTPPLYAAYAAQLWWMLRRVGRFGPVTAVLYPIPLLAFLAVFARSLVSTARGEVTWRGRAVHTR